MKLRLTQEGFATYAGQMGVIFFEDGLSTADVAVRDAVRMSAVMGCEWEDGTPASVAQSILDNAHTPAPMFVSGADGQHDPTTKYEGAGMFSAAPVAPQFVEAELEALADKEGIKGLRVLADPLNIKGNSIKDLIAALLKV